MLNLTPERWAALKPLLDEALELKPEARTGWLETQRTTNPVLAREIEALLAHETALEVERFLEQESAAPSPLATSLEGQQLGPWRLERQIGQGGMGSVWLARRSDGRFEGIAAIKFLSLALAGSSGEARFRREGSVLARLSHPNIARLLDAGMSPSGQPYLVLEHVDGTPLDRWCEARGLDTAARIRLFRQVLDAVAHAHAVLIVHRDLKPANILVTEDGRVKLLDFGIAKLLEEGGDGHAVTGAEERLLTIEYAAPEQVRSEPISTATDVYALGVVLYKLLTGRHPTSPGTAGPAEQIRGILETEPARLPAGFAADLDTIVARALHKDPAERYQAVTALAEDLDRFLRHEPISARPATWGYRAGKFVRRNRGAMAAAALVTLALIGTTAYALRQGAIARRERDQALVSLKRQMVMTSVQEVMAGDSRGANGRPLTASERLELAARMLETKYRSEPWLVVEGITNLSTRYYESGELTRERDLLARAQAIARSNDLPAQLALANCERVYTFAFDEKFDSAATELAEAKAALARLAEPPSEVRVVCLHAEGQLRAAQEQWDAAIPLLQQAVEQVADVPDAGTNASTLQLQAINELATALRGAGRTRDAARYQRQVIAGLMQGGYALTDLMGSALSYLTGSLLELGEFRALDSALRPVLAVQESAQGPGHAAGTVSYYHGTELLRVGEYDSALVWLTRAVHDDPRDPASNSGVHVWAPATLTELALLRGRLPEARRHYAGLPTGTYPRRIMQVWLGAWIRCLGGDSLGASRALEDSLRVFEGVSPRSPRLSLPLLSVAEWRMARGEWGAADSLALEARRHAAVDSLALVQSGYAGRAELLHARARIALEDLPAAREAARRAAVALSYAFGPEHPRTQAANALADSLSTKH